MNVERYEQLSRRRPVQQANPGVAALRRLFTGVLLLSMLGFAACTTPRVGDAAPAADALIDKAYIYEVVRHLYRWHLDAEDLAQPTHGQNLVFWGREIHPHLDSGDHSRFGEIIFPGFGVLVTVKKSDYRIEEFGTEVKSKGFKIISVSRQAIPSRKPAEFASAMVEHADMVQYLFDTRNARTFPGDELLERMRSSVGNVVREDFERRGEPLPKGEHIVHLAPLSPVANEAWLFWETGRRLIRVASDMELEKSPVWKLDDVFVDVYHLDHQVVVSMNEAAGSNAYLTRDQIGRALYNCVVLGKRMVLPPPGGPAAATSVQE